MATRQLQLIMAIFSCLCSTQGEVIHLPTFSWDNDNHFFKCQDPTLRIPIDHQMDIHCPTPTVHNYLTNNVYKAVPIIRMVNVKDEEHYNKCNITGALPGLYCGGTAPVNQKCESKGCTPYYNIFTGTIQKTLKPGHTYYFIATTDTGNTELCKGINNKPPMKLKIYVCTADEMKSGLCETCQSEACYYKGCQERCSDWIPGKIYKDVNGNCIQHQTQTCSNPIISISSNRTRETPILCPTPICQSWQNVGDIIYRKKTKKCYQPQEHDCNLDGLVTKEKRELLVNCPASKCLDWKLVKTITTENVNSKSCYRMEERICFFNSSSKVSDLKDSYMEYRDKTIACPKPTICPTLSPIKPEASTKTPSKTLSPTIKPRIEIQPQIQQGRSDRQDKDIDTYIYITIGASIGALIIGIMIGYYLTKFCQGKQEPVEVVKTIEKVIPMEGIGPIMSYDNKNFNLDPVLEDSQSFTMGMGDIAFIPTSQEIGTTKRQVMVARSVSFYNPEAMNTLSKQQRKSSTEYNGQYRPPRTVQESRRNVMRHPSATSKTVLIRHHSDVTERPRSDSDTSVFTLKAPEDMMSEEV